MLDKFAEIINVLPWDRIEGNTLFLELDEVSYKEVVEEYKAIAGSIGDEVTAPDFGKCMRLVFSGKNILMVVNRDRKVKEFAYVAFKTKLV